MRKFAMNIIKAFALFPLFFAFEVNAQNNNVPIILGEKIEGNLSINSPKLEADNSPYQSFLIKVKKGQRLKITINSSDFMPFFNLGKIESNKICSICINSNMIDNNNSIAIMDILEDGELNLRITTNKPDNYGKFSFTTQLDEIPKFAPKQINFDQKITGILQYDDELGDNSDLMDNYFIKLEANDFVEIKLDSDDFDPHLVIINDDGFYKIDFNGGKNNNSKINFHAPKTGIYYIHALSELLKTGKYELKISKITQEKPIKSIPILFGRKNFYSLYTDDIETNEGDDFHAKRFKLMAKKGKKYWIDAQSTEIDLKMEIGTQTKDGNFYVIQEDDNSGESSNPLIFFTAQEDGEYFLRIGESLNSNNKIVEKSGKQKIGNFSLNIKEAIENPLPKNAKIIHLGQAVKDKFIASGPRDNENKLIKFYSLYLNSGQNIEVSMQNDLKAKKPVNPHIEIGIGKPDKYEILFSKEENNIAKINFTPNKTQNYLIIARAQSPVSNGDFIINSKNIK